MSAKGPENKVGWCAAEKKIPAAVVRAVNRIEIHRQLTDAGDVTGRGAAAHDLARDLPAPRLWLSTSADFSVEVITTRLNHNQLPFTRTTTVKRTQSPYALPLATRQSILQAN